MNRLGLRNNRLKLETSGELLIILEESIQEYTSNEWKQNQKMMSTCNRLDLESLGSWLTMPQNLPGNGMWCSILKSSTLVKYHFGCQIFLFVFEHFTKMCSAKFPPILVKASPKIACHKIQWLQFASRNIAKLQSSHSDRHFLSSNNCCNFNFETSPRHWLQLRLGKHNYVWMWISQTELGEEWLQKSIET